MGKIFTVLLIIALIASLSLLAYVMKVYIPKMQSDIAYKSGYDAFSAGYMMGADNATKTTIGYIIDETLLCKQVPVSLGDKQSILVSTSCLQKA